VHPSGIKVIPAALSMSKASTKMKRIRSKLEKLNQLTIVDFPPGFTDNVIALMKASDELLIITTPEKSAVTDAMKSVKVAKSLEKKVLGVVVNRFKNDRFELKPDNIESLCESPVVQVIPEDDRVRKASFSNRPVTEMYPYSPASIAIKQLAAKLIGKKYIPPRFVGIRRILGLK
ncbi:MAG TPA: septum site-determining protein MinD, partial [Candidatus Aenigmarchaeota archaeon]|nr:septum site-determining protein MinD [Candidatus Aenigmarchaeota archaeon]HEX33065.1 septum site-determining protein MinD [Candidatus Aenigmarchaeota archaeon]